uniref:Interleukin-13 receptor subunit alpha-1-like n=1 Tax=Podarcis muralis TaxID=64176 RepID=A0A670JNG9_PODMU|nr:interleukin-13 receptor subunit alpha-1-like [Podarcis muralis]XP_028558132.1 interleukin-13 receptor subunit alpha-1-like [Podarcis muralis]
MKASPRSRSGDEMWQGNFMGTLVLLLVTLIGAVRGATLTLPRPSNVSYTLNETRCQLDVVWTPVRMEGACDVKYQSAITTDGVWDVERIHTNHSRTVQVPLGKEVVFGVRTKCQQEQSQKGEWLNISLPQNGVPGTGAVNVSCVWQMERSLECSWLRGENASRDANYSLTLWIPELRREQPCTNYTKQGGAFRCAFDLKYQWIELSISLQGNSKDIQPVCILSKMSGKGRFPVRLKTPSIVNITKNNGGVFLNWTKPSLWSNMNYEVEINNSGRPDIQPTHNTNISISLKPKAHHTFRVRAKFYSSGEIWTSDWSEVVDWDERDHTLYIPYILAPLCVAVLTVIFLIYRKRIKEMILPTIPEPRNFLEQMFDGESEDYSKVKSVPEDPKLS